jgi:hypothetical protein
MAKLKTLEQIDASLARWQTRLKRAVNAIEKLGKQRKRLLMKPHLDRVKARATAANAPAPTPAPPDLAVAPPLAKAARGWSPERQTFVKEDTGIPAFLQRSKPDAVGEQIAKEIAERSKAKARGRIAKMKAKKSGETRKMPLTGRAALDAIRNG